MLKSSHAWLADPEFSGWEVIEPLGWDSRGLSMDDWITVNHFREALFDSRLVRVYKQAADGTITSLSGTAVST